MNKNYMVVMLPNEEQSGTIEINRADIFESFDEAFEQFSELVGANAPARPRFANPLDFEERDGSRIQLWVVQIPEVIGVY